MFLVVAMVALLIAAMAGIMSARVEVETRLQAHLEAESQAMQNAYAQINLALSVVTNSGYDSDARNQELQDAINGEHGGTVVEAAADEDTWVDQPEDPDYGFVGGTSVRVYRGRDYVRRLQRLKGEEMFDVDPLGNSDSYFVLEAVGRERDTMRLVSVLLRENEPFSTFVLLQNRHTLGVSGSPRGSIHANAGVEFYYPNGQYVDPVSAVSGFAFKAGATAANTDLSDSNPSARTIDAGMVDFDDLRTAANVFRGQPGLDAEIKLDGHKVEIREVTPPRYEMVDHTYTYPVLVGYDEETETVTQQVQVGTTTETLEREIIAGYGTENYDVEVPVYEDQQVTQTVNVPVYETQTVTRTRWVQVFEPYETDQGGTTVGGEGDTVPGEYVWVEEEYETEEQVIVAYTTEEVTVTQSVQVGTTTETRTRSVPIYETEEYEAEVPVYEEQEVEQTLWIPVYEDRSITYQLNELIPPQSISTTKATLDGDGTIFIEGRVTKLGGKIDGRLTIASNDSVRVTDSLRYVDDDGETAMLNGDDHTKPYERNPDYRGESVLGVIARKDVLYATSLPDQAEINASFVAAQGRVGIEGLAIQDDGSPTSDPYYGLTTEETAVEAAYAAAYGSAAFVKNSLRRIGAAVSDNRILESYIRSRDDGSTYVHAGFKRGRMQYDIGMAHRPPPSFPVIPRPKIVARTPVVLVLE